MDYLAEKLKAEQRKEMSDATKARKAGKRERIAAMLKNLVKEEPAPSVDLLGVLGE